MKTLVALLLVSTFSFAGNAANMNIPIHTHDDVTQDYDFGEVTIGQGASTTFEVTAEKDMYFTSVSMEGKDFWGETDCLGELNATYTCYIEVNFDPQEAADYTGVVKAVTDMGTLTLNIKGKGVQAAPQQ